MNDSRSRAAYRIIRLNTIALPFCRGNKGTIFVLKKVDTSVDSTAAFASQIDLKPTVASGNSKVKVFAPVSKV